jgi:hypothetical protein
MVAQRGLDDTLRFAEHEGTDHPVACMLLRSTSEADAVNGFLTLEREAHTLPELLVERHASSTMLNHYVLVHDALVRPASLRCHRYPLLRRRQRQAVDFARVCGACAPSAGRYES